MYTNQAGAAVGDQAFYPWGDAWLYWGVDGYNFASLDYYDTSTTTVLAPFRVFSPNIGRWHSPDPLGGDVTNPQSLNRYAYVLNNPMTLTDPTGLNPCPTIGPGGSYACTPEQAAQSNVSGPAGSIYNGIAGANPFSLLYLMTSLMAEGSEPVLVNFGAWDLISPANSGESICSGAAGKTIHVSAPSGQMRFQFNGSGNLTGVGVQLTGLNVYSGSGLSIPPNTFAGFTQLSPGTVQFGFNNPVNVGSGFSQAYFQNATFSGGKFTSVQGAYAPLGIPLGSSSGNSSLLQWYLNGNSSVASQAQNFGNLLTSVASLMSSNVSCRDVFGGGQQ
jgi:RHS repeat-associated protein